MGKTVKRKAKKIIRLEPVAPVEQFYLPERDGVTFGLLSTWQACRERARLFLEGWSGSDSVFALMYGTMTHHLIQHALDQHVAGTLARIPGQAWVAKELGLMERQWYTENPTPRAKAEEMLQEALMKNQAVMPHYFKYWKTDFDRETRTWLEVEKTFRLAWVVTTRTGRRLETFLRGRKDGAYIISGTSRRTTRPRLLETKTRSDIDEQILIDTMPQERQLSTYLSVLRKQTGQTPSGAVLNIIRKPQLRRKVSEDWGAFRHRIEKDVVARPDWYFVRMQLSVTDQEINRSEEELNELISDFLLWRAGESGHYKNTRVCVEYRRPCDFVKVCSHGDYTGLIKRPVVFRELEDE